MCHIPFLPLQRLTASYGSELTEAVQRVVQSGYYLNGEALAEFEQQFAHYVQAPHWVGVASGLDALMLSLMAMKQCYDWSDGDEVIVPDMTFVATALAVVRAGLVPVSADVDDNGLLTPEAAQRVLSARTRAVVPVHLYGHPAPMPAFMAWAEAHGLLVLEDAAQAHGASVGGRPVGSWGHMAAFSFYPGKNLGALGDGGAVTTAHPQLAEHVRMLANYGARQKYHHEYPGINSRLDEVQAAVLSVKLRRLDADNARRRQVAAWYAQGLDRSMYRLPYGGDVTQSVFHLYPLRTSQRDALQRYLAEHCIDTLIHYPRTLRQQPALSASLRAPQPCQQAQCWAEHELSLPIHPLLTLSEVQHICEVMNAFG